MDGEVAKVAGKLSERQRKCILAMTGRYSHVRVIGAAPSTLYSLWDFKRDFSSTETGIAPPVMLVSRDVCDQPLCYEWALTDLGLKVRDHLKVPDHAS